jgi:uncharacterized protein (TIGR02646 family)
MRRVSKRAQPPAELTRYRKAARDTASFDGFPRKDVLRVALLEDQRFLCCYCMRRIDVDGMKIEHFKPRRYTDLELEWQNLHGACDGNEGHPRHLQTGDTSKADTEIVASPLVETHAKYLATGRVLFPDATHQRDADEILNLNAPHLVRGRASTLDALMAALQKRLGATRSWTRARLEAELERYRSSPKLEHFFGAIEYWLEKHIRQR